MVRPRKSTAEDRRDQRIRVHVNAAEKTYLRERAGRLSLSTYLRKAGLGEPIPKQRQHRPIPELNSRVLFALGTLAEELHILRHLCSDATRKGQGCNVDLELFDKLHQQLRALGWAIADIDPDADEEDDE